MSRKIPDDVLSTVQFHPHDQSALLLSLVAPGILAAGAWGRIAALITGLWAYKTGNLLLPIGLGIAIMALQRNFLTQ